MILKIYAETQGKTNIIIIVLIDLKKNMREDTVFLMRAKTHILIVLRKHRLFH